MNSYKYAIAKLSLENCNFCSLKPLDAKINKISNKYTIMTLKTYQNNYTPTLKFMQNKHLIAMMISKNKIVSRRKALMFDFIR